LADLKLHRPYYTTAHSTNPVYQKRKQDKLAVMEKQFMELRNGIDRVSQALRDKSKPKKRNE